MFDIKFYDKNAEFQFKYAVIVAKSGGKWVFCQHRERNTYEFPGGHRENGEHVHDAAKRELYEETGALDYSLRPVCAYSVTEKGDAGERGEETFGMLYYADIRTFEPTLHWEIERIILTDTLPEHWTYPKIQPVLMEKAAAAAGELSGRGTSSACRPFGGTSAMAGAQAVMN